MMIVGGRLLNTKELLKHRRFIKYDISRWIYIEFWDQEIGKRFTATELRIQ